MAFAAVAAVLAALGVLVFVAGPRRFGPGALNTSTYRFIPLAAEPADETSPSWSPDGKSVVYTAEVGGVKQLFTREPRLGRLDTNHRSSTDTVAPFWSSDGTRIYFTSQSTPGGDVWSVGANGGEPQLVMKDAGAATVTPDGKTLAFLRGVGGRRSLWIASARW